MYSSLNSFGIEGIKSYLVNVEVDSRRGLPGFDIVGLPDTAVKESRDRIHSAIKNLGYPIISSKIVANLAPADKRKQGSVYDLPILLALLCACGYEDFDFSGLAVVGEIGLFGEIRGVAGVLPMVLDAKSLGINRVIVPKDNMAEASAAENVKVYVADHVKEVIAFLKGEKDLPLAASYSQKEAEVSYPIDFSDVKGQQEAKRAMEVAAAGGHNLLLL